MNINEVGGEQYKQSVAMGVAKKLMVVMILLKMGQNPQNFIGDKYHEKVI